MTGPWPASPEYPKVSGVDDVVARVGRELLRHDVRHPHLDPGEQYVLVFHRLPQPGEIVLVHRDGDFALAVAPVDGWVVAIVRVLEP
jgi:hypothetical protein